MKHRPALLIATLVALSGLLVFLLPSWRWEDARLDSIVDGAVSIMVFTTFLMLWLSHDRQKDGGVGGIAYAFLVTAVLRFIDSATENTERSAWFHLICAGILGFAFLFEWAPLPTSRLLNRNRLHMLTLVVGVGAFAGCGFFPGPIHGNSFTPLFRGIVFVASLPFFAAAGLRWWNWKENQPLSLALFTTCLFLGLGTLLIAFTNPWETRWWIAQFTELGPQLFLMFSLFLFHDRRMLMIRDRLRSSNDQLEKFASVASHDLKEPLRMISAYLKLLERRNKGKWDETSEEFLWFAQDGAQRLDSLLDALLSYARLESRTNAFEAVDLNTVFEKASQNLGFAIAESGARVTHQTLPTVTGESIFLVQLFQNLFSNAIKYRRKDSPPLIDVRAEKQRDRWVICVSDNGQGFSMADAKVIFDAFRRLHSKSECPGTGLGLATCKKIVERHGGKIWAEAAPGKGAAFYFTLAA